MTKWPIKKLSDRGYRIMRMLGFWLDSKSRHVAAFGIVPGATLLDHMFEWAFLVIVVGT